MQMTKHPQPVYTIYRRQHQTICTAHIQRIHTPRIHTPYTQDNMHSTYTKNTHTPYTQNKMHSTYTKNIHTPYTQYTQHTTQKYTAHVHNIHNPYTQPMTSVRAYNISENTLLRMYLVSKCKKKCSRACTHYACIHILDYARFCIVHVQPTQHLPKSRAVANERRKASCMDGYGVALVSRID